MTSAPAVEYDEEAQALYLRFSSVEIDDTIVLCDAVYLDVDVEGETVGIEILHATPTDFPNLAAADGSISLKELLRSQAA